MTILLLVDHMIATPEAYLPGIIVALVVLGVFVEIANRLARR